MIRFVLLTALAAAGALALSAAAVAAPTLKASPSFAGSRLVVTVTSAKAFTRRTLPRAVKVAVGGATYKLKPAKRSARKSTWRSGALGSGQLTALYAKQVRISVKTLAGTVTQRRSTPARPAAPPDPDPAPAMGPIPYTIPPVPTPPSGPAPPTPFGATLTRDDAAGRAALSGDLLLERAVESGTATVTYDRIFLYGTGVYRTEQVSGEICDSAARREGTWKFAEGYTYPENGGGVVVVIATVTEGQVDRALLLFGNAEPNIVFIGTAGTPYERKPDIREQC